MCCLSYCFKLSSGYFLPNIFYKTDFRFLHYSFSVKGAIIFTQPHLWSSHLTNEWWMSNLSKTRCGEGCLFSPMETASSGLLRSWGKTHVPLLCSRVLSVLGFGSRNVPRISKPCACVKADVIEAAVWPVKALLGRGWVFCISSLPWQMQWGH